MYLEVNRRKSVFLYSIPSVTLFFSQYNIYISLVISIYQIHTKNDQIDFLYMDMPEFNSSLLPCLGLL